MIAAYTIAGLYVFWIFYLAVMALFSAKEKGTLPKAALILGYPVLIVGAIIDLAMNAAVFSIIFFEPPKEWLVTKRLARHIKKGSGWRQKLAKWICENLLDAFDPDHRGHCH